MTPDVGKKICLLFNMLYPVGTPVMLINDMGEEITTSTKWPAYYRENSGGATIGLDGIDGYYKLDRVIPLPSSMI